MEVLERGVELYRPRLRQTDPMATSSRPSSYHYVVDEPMLRTIAAEIQAAIPGAQVRLFGSRARGTERPDSDLDLLVTVPDEWLGSHSRFVETDALGWKLAHHRLPIELLLFSASEVEERQHGRINVIAEAFRYGRQLEPLEALHGAG
jgi:predicted nucleotidyltransferase